MKAKLNSKRGESLAEILAALLVMTGAMIVLAAGLGAAPRVRRVEENYGNRTDEISILINGVDAKSCWYHEKDGLRYYDEKEK